jgi:hypothetical protein
VVGEGGILPELAQHLMQATLEAEMDQHLAAEAGTVGGRDSSLVSSHRAAGGPDVAVFRVDARGVQFGRSGV